MRHLFYLFCLFIVAPAWAAQLVDFKRPLQNPSQFTQISREVDFNQTVHLKLEQNYSGYPVWGSDAIIHVPQGESVSLQSLTDHQNVRVDGKMYEGLSADLSNTPAYIFNSAQADKALQQAIELYQKNKEIHGNVTDTNSHLIVYVDKKNKAHWAFLICFLVQQGNLMPAKPNYILDAETFVVYETWNAVQTLEETTGGGFGGNEKIGKIIYDGYQHDDPVLAIERSTLLKKCFLKNPQVTVKNANQADAVVRFDCLAQNQQHHSIYWDADKDAINGGYSPSNDALYLGAIVQQMYQTWYGIPALMKDNKPMMLEMRVHVKDEQGQPMENAYWDGRTMSFGDGQTLFYPLTSLGVGAHEISHGFTQQHSGLVPDGQSGGLNESFSDMAAQAAEFYAHGHNNWQIGAEISKVKNRALRYMDEPTKDCELGQRPGNNCSISRMEDYYEGLDVHFSAGIFNKLFYLMSTAPGWNTKKAFDVMVQANRYYWTSHTTFLEAACGVLKATEDYKYSVEVVHYAMTEVGLDISRC